MSNSATTTFNTNAQLNTNFEHRIVFLGSNDYRSIVYTNSSGSEVTIPQGSVIGTVSTSGLALPLESDATDGSQFPTGINTVAVTVANGESATLSVCISGEVNENYISFFNGTDTMNTAVDGRILRDRIAADTLGVLLTSSDELTEFDNQ